MNQKLQSHETYIMPSQSPRTEGQLEKGVRLQGWWESSLKSMEDGHELSCVMISKGELWLTCRGLGVLPGGPSWHQCDHNYRGWKKRVKLWGEVREEMMRAWLDSEWGGWGPDGEVSWMSHVAGLGNGIPLFTEREGLHMGTQRETGRMILSVDTLWI